MVWVSQQQRMPRLLYWGDALPADTELGTLVQALQQPLPHGALDVAEEVSWLPEPGRGFTDAPGLTLRRGEQHLYTQFVLDAATRTPSGWCFSLSDAAAALALELHIAIDADTAVCSAHTVLINRGRGPLAIEQLVSLALPVPAQFSQRLCFGGRWAQEFVASRQPLADGAWLQESRVGRSSHHAYPGLSLLSDTTNASTGEVISLQLECSGNHRLLLQRRRLGGWQLQAGELLLPGEVVLAPGEQHATPTVHLARSGAGTSGVSTVWHRFVRNQILPCNLSQAPRLVQFNSWEATYFDHDSDRLKALAQAAADVGVERFVLDDGWFVGRHHDRAGLGDWSACPQRYPQGLLPLATHCQQLGMRFGLWVEPESVNADSALYRAHPEWVLGDPTRDNSSQPLGRHQFVLNFALAAVREQLFEQLSALLRGAPIDFFKWDMNRDMSHANGPDQRAAARAHVHGVHALMDRLRAAHPALEIETCASGGGRADLAMLRRCERVWVSDNNDPLERQRIQSGFLHFLPPEVMGVHVGDAQSHITGRVSSVALCTLNALFGHFGVEANLLEMPPAKRAALRAAIQFYKAERHGLHSGALSVIDSPDPALKVLLAINANRSKALVSVVALASPTQAQTAPLRLPGLDTEALYAVRLHPLWLATDKASKTPAPLQAGETLQLRGQLLAQAGLTLPILRPGEALLYELVMV
jgi:alpha-galactosidase